MLGPIGKNLSVESFQDFLIEFDMKFDLIFKILYFPKMCPIFVGSVDNLLSICILANEWILQEPQETV